MGTPNLKDMTKDERSLLVFFESAAVEHGGYLNTQHMNKEDSEIAKSWAESGFIVYKRIPFKKVKEMGGRYTQDVSLSPTAWSLAQEERRARSKRIRDSRS